MRKNILRSIFIAPAILIVWCFFFVTGCKEPIIKETDLLTSDDNLFLDTALLGAKAFTIAELPAVSSGLTIAPLGNMIDPVFGKTFASVYFQFAPAGNNVSFGESPVLDSVVLMLKYSGQYAKFDQPVDLQVYELAQTLGAGISYHTNDAFLVNAPAIGSSTGFLPTPYDSIYVYGKAYEPHIRIRLSESFGNKILLADSTTLSAPETFLNMLKGLYVTTNPSFAGNGIMYVNLRSSVSAVALYYHNAAGDSVTTQIPVAGVSVVHFDHNYNGTPVQTAVLSPNQNGDEKVYIQAGIGTKAKIILNGLDSLPGNIAFNKAELVFTQAFDPTGFDTIYRSPLLLNLLRLDETGSTQKLDDEFTNHFGGTRETVTIGGTKYIRYRFNISIYLQKLIQGNYTNNGLILSALSPNNNAERVVIANSSSDSNYQILLRITYTKL